MADCNLKVPELSISTVKSSCLSVKCHLEMVLECIKVKHKDFSFGVVAGEDKRVFDELLQLAGKEGASDTLTAKVRTIGAKFALIKHTFGKMASPLSDSLDKCTSRPHDFPNVAQAHIQAITSIGIDTLASFYEAAVTQIDEVFAEAVECVAESLKLP